MDDQAWDDISDFKGVSHPPDPYWWRESNPHEVVKSHRVYR